MKDKTTSHIECYNYHNKGQYAQDFLEKNNGPCDNTRSNNRFHDRIRRDDGSNDHNGRDEKRSYILQVTMKKINVLKRNQDILGMKVMLANNLNIFLFMLLLVPLLRICGIVGWLIVGLHITSLVIMNLKIIHGDSSTHPVNGFGFVKFHLNLEESIFLHNVIYMLGQRIIWPQHPPWKKKG